MKIKPIRNEKDYEEALKTIESLMDAEEGSERGDRLDVWVTLVEAFEAKNFPIETTEPVAAIEFVMEQQSLTSKNLEEYIGSRARVWEVLNHKRGLTLPMIRRLNEGLGIPAEILIQAPSNQSL